MFGTATCQPPPCAPVPCFFLLSKPNTASTDRAFDALLAEMQREYNPEPEKKKSGWWPFS